MMKKGRRGSMWIRSLGSLLGSKASICQFIVGGSYFFDFTVEF